jgi:hypothetical protein
MSLEITGRLLQVLQIQKGTSSRGEWQKQEFIVETQDGQYSKKICFNVWGEDKIADLSAIGVGSDIKVMFNIESREYNSRWYTDVRAWRIEKLDGSNVEDNPFGDSPSSSFAPTSTEDTSDDLPF